MVALNNDIAYIIAFACECFLYGAYSVLFTVSTTLFYRRRHRRPVHLPLISAHFFLFFLATVHFALEFNHYCVYLANSGVVGYANETKKLGGADIIMSLLDFVGECVLVYRCYLVWGRNWKVAVLPFLAALAGFICIMEMMHLVLTLDPTAPHPPAAITPLGTAGYTLPLATNVMVTLLIVLRVWAVSSGAPDEVTGTRRIRNHAMEIVVESGLLYLVVQLVYVVLFNLDNPADQIVGIIAVQIYGIAPTLILVRVGLGLSDEFTSKISTGPIVWATRSAFATHPGSEPGLSTTRFTNELEWDAEKGSKLRSLTDKDKTDDSDTQSSSSASDKPAPPMSVAVL